MGLSNEVIFTLVAHGAAKLPDVKVGGMKKSPGVDPGPHSSGVDRA